MVKIAVVGGGVNGLTCAVKVVERFKDFDVVLISDKFSPNTTGDGSGGLWYPYLCQHTPEHLIAKWGCETYEFLWKLWLEGGHDISMMPVIYLYSQEGTYHHPVWSKNVFGYHELGQKELNYFSNLYSSKYVAGEIFTTFVVLPPSILAYLTKRFENANGKILHGKISSLQDPLLDQYDVVINCTGLGSRYIVPDSTMYPVRGQISKVSAPWLYHTVLDKQRGNYIIPNVKNCVLGGTGQKNDYNLNVDEEDYEHISKGCQAIIPSLKNAKLLKQWVGLRPGRDEIRLESEERDSKFFIHNYGHGGSGMTLFWGCGSDVLEILQKYINSKTLINKSKL